MKKLAYGFVLAFAAMAAANVFAAGALPSGDTNLSILPIPDQLCRAGVEPEPGFTVTNRETGVYWVHREIYASAIDFPLAFYIRIYYNICYAKQKL